MKVSIIGCGYVGTALARYLRSLRSGYTVTAITRSENRVHELMQTFDRVCVAPQGDKAALARALDGEDGVVVSVAPDAAADYSTTYLGTANTLHGALEEIKSRLKSPFHVVYTGSTSVYGEKGGEVVDENTLPSPSHESGRILVETEEAILNMRQFTGVIPCVLRLGEIVGPGREISARLRRMEEKFGECVMPGNGSNITNIIHVDDIVKALEIALREPLSGIYNLCSDLHITRRELYDRICTMNKLSQVRWDPAKPTIHGGNRIVSNSKIRKFLGASHEASFSNCLL